MGSRNQFDPVRRKFLSLSGSALAAVASPSVMSAKAWAQSKTFVIYSFDGVLGRAFKEQVIPPFEQRHGVRIETITMPGSVPPMQKIKAMVEAGQAGSRRHSRCSSRTTCSRDATICSCPLAASDIPEYKNLYPQFITDHGPGLLLWSYGIAYNTRHIKEEPTSWRELWNPPTRAKSRSMIRSSSMSLQMVNLTFTGQALAGHRSNLCQAQRAAAEPAYALHDRRAGRTAHAARGSLDRRDVEFADRRRAGRRRTDEVHRAEGRLLRALQPVLHPAWRARPRPRKDMDQLRLQQGAARA